MSAVKSSPSTSPPPTSPPPPPHVLIFPFPAQGHLLPLLDLTHQLATRNLTLTILTTPKNLPTLSSLLSAHHQIQTLILPFPPHPLLPPGVENVKDLGNAGVLPIMAALTKLSDPIAEWFGSRRQPPVAIISDVFLGWTQRLADELNVPRFTFFPTRVLMAAVFDHCFGDPDALKGKDVVEFVDLPKTVSLRYEHLPSLFRRYRASDPDWEAVRDGMIANMSSFGCIFYDFNASEPGWARSSSGRIYLESEPEPKCKIGSVQFWVIVFLK